jgi:ankyrin repeat protein
VLLAQVLLRGLPGVAARLAVGDEQNMTPLHWACFNDNAVAVQLLLNAVKAEVVEKVDHEGKTALHFCASNATPASVKLVLKKAPKCINAVDKEGRTALHLCVGEQNVSVSEFLVKAKGCNVNIKDSTGRTPLHW